MYLEKEKIIIKNDLEIDETKVKNDKSDLERYESVGDTAKNIVICVGLLISVVVAIYFFVIEGKFSVEVVLSLFNSTVVGFISSCIIGAAFCHFKTKDIEDEYTLNNRLERYDLLNQEIHNIAVLQKILSEKDTTVLLHDDYRTIEILGLGENGLEQNFTININNVYYKDTDSFSIIYKIEDDNSLYRDVRCFYVDLELPREYFARLTSKL